MKSAKENMRGEKGWKNVETKHSHASTAAHKLVKGVTEKRVQADLNRRPAELQSAALPLSYTPSYIIRETRDNIMTACPSG